VGSPPDETLYQVRGRFLILAAKHTLYPLAIGGPAWRSSSSRGFRPLFEVEPSRSQIDSRAAAFARSWPRAAPGNGRRCLVQA